MKKIKVLSPSMGVESYMTKAGGFSSVRNANDADLIVFTGGSDVSPTLYGEKVLPVSFVNLQRDLEEKDIFERYKSIPKVGICRGGQFLNVMSGGKMFQDVSNHTRSHYMVNLLKTDGIDDDKLLVTSTHHQMMRPGPKGHVLAIALNEENNSNRLSSRYLAAEITEFPEYDTEVVWYPETNSLCFQPHPEFSSGTGALKPMSDYFFKLVDYFFFDNGNPETV
jgi:GMP synthase-like glutamine amidotransferase